VSHSEELTYPDDYREILSAPSKPVLVGGQAVNLWASIYLPDPKGIRYGSADLDVLSSERVLSELAALPDWNYKRRPLVAFGDIRDAVMDQKTPGGKKLHVEILKTVKGLEKADLNAVVDVTSNEVAYRVLDPVVMLKAKAHNITSFTQDGPEPRQDVPHFRLLSKVVPAYLRDVHEEARLGAFPTATVEKTLRTLFKTMQDKKIAGVFNREKIGPDELVPAEFANSFSEVIRQTMTHQMPLARRCVENARFKTGPQYAQGPQV
jgi:hypothetical protein